LFFKVKSKKIKIGWDESKIAQSLTRLYSITKTHALIDIKELIADLKKKKIVVGVLKFYL